MARLDPRQPVLVGVAAASQRLDDPMDAAPAIELMGRALTAAIDDAGTAALADRIGWIGVPEGSWAYGDPGRLLAERLGVDGVHTVRADVGITQQDLIGRACSAVLDGAAVAVVAGGEAKYRSLRGAMAGVEVADVVDGRTPDELVAAGRLPCDDLEIIRNTVVPSTSYAMVEQALAHHRGQTPTDHRRQLADLWGGFAAVAAANPAAWDRSGRSGDQLVQASAGNRMIATPYTKALCSDWNVDQAAALVICSVDAAASLGVPRDRWVFPHASVVSNWPDLVVSRAHLHESVGARIAGERALSSAGIGIDDVRVVDLYSCFPAAVQVFAAAVGLPLGRPLTVTGGMRFAGGPLNNYVVQAMVRLVGELRAAPTTFGLSSSVSGSLVKQGWGVWSGRPPREGFRHEDCGPEVAAASEPRPIEPTLEGDVAIAGSTVVHEAGDPAEALAIVEGTRGQRSIVTSREVGIVEAMLEGDWIGRSVSATANGGFSLGSTG